MQLAVFATFTVFLVVALGHAQAFGGFGRPHPPRGPPPFFFPKCQDFADVVEAQKRQNEQNGDGGPRACRNTDMTPPECRFNDMLKARNQLPNEQPSQDCLDQVQSFFQGSTAESTTVA